jgi:uncharacterized protein YjiS (DUF1127 family)
MAQARSAAPASRSENSALVRIFVRLMRTMKHRRRVRRSIATLDSFNDRTLADIGLRRDRSNPSQFSPL